MTPTCPHTEDGLHRADTITRGTKCDSFDVTCPCGETVCAGTWWVTLPGGWNQLSAPSALDAGRALMSNPNITD